MQKRTITTYTFDELSKEAQAKAIEDHRTFISETMDDQLSESMREKLDELLKENQITDYDIRSLYYSLSYSQGDGAMFEGIIRWKNWEVVIAHVGHYYNSNSKEISITNPNADAATDDAYADDKVYEEFETLYQKICKQLEKYGYGWIDNELEEENVKEELRMNEYEFLRNGAIYSAV